MRVRPSGVVLIGVTGLLAFVAAAGAPPDESGVVRVMPNESEGAQPSPGPSDPGPPCELTTTESLDHEAVSAQQGELFEDSRRVQTYGDEHPDEFGQMWFDNGPIVRIAVGFTGHLDEHRTALEALVDHRDRLVVHEVPYSVRALEDTQAAVWDLIEGEAGEVALGGGISLCSVHVELPPGLDDVAQLLLDRFPGVLDVSVGGHRFPLEPAVPLNCPAVEGDDAAAHGVAIDMRFGDGSIRTGDAVEGTASITNNGAEAITVIYGGHAAVAVVVAPGTRQPVGLATGGRDDSLGSLGLAPGETGDVPFEAGVSACDPSSGSAVPPGRYGLLVTLEILVGVRDANGYPEQPSTTWIGPEVAVVIE